MAGVTQIVKDKLRDLSGEVIHVVAENNSLIRLRIDETGRILYDRSISTLRGETLQNVKSRLADTKIVNGIQMVRQQSKRSWRKAVTGDPDKKIRDYIKEVPQVKFVDKLSFTLGVTCIILTEFLALRHPELFLHYYVTLMAILLTFRLHDYKSQKMELFMADFCYFMNLSTVVQTWFYPDNLYWYKANYVLCMGCLMMAIIIWNNSLVFHSLDKLTSFFLHAFPPLHIHLHRWGLIPCDAIKLDDYLSLEELFILPLVLFAIWQVGYLILTEIILFNYMESDPEITTSMRHLAVDKKNSMHQLTKKICRTLGIMTKEEVFDTRTNKTKMIFLIAQLIFTIFAILPTPLLYSNYNISVVYISFIYGWCVWRGGSYYIEVFSERYKLKFVKDEQGHNMTSQSSVDTDSDEEQHHDVELYHEIMKAINEAHDGDAEKKEDDPVGEKTNEDDCEPRDN